MALNTTHTGIKRRSTAALRVAHGMLSLLLSLLCVGAVSAATSTPSGTRIINVANVTSAEQAGVFAGSATITVRSSSTPQIEFLQYSPTLPGAEQVPLALGAYRPGADPALPFISVPPPQMTGSSTPIDLTRPVPLTPAVLYHQGDPIFLRVTDLSMNLDPNLRETLFATVTVPMTGDVEVVRITETGNNTGVFVGYIPSNSAAGVQYNGTLQIKAESLINASYTNPFEGITVASAIMVDPYGIFIDTRTGQLVSGATITMINTVTNQPAVVYGDDGASSYPATLTSGGNAVDSSGKLYTFPDGGYRFPFVLPGSYRFEIHPPTGYTSPSTVATSVIQALPGAPFAIANGSRGELFQINPGPALRIDIPLDPSSSLLWMTKSAGREVVAPGDFVSYDLTLSNTSKIVNAANVRIVDMLPAGFRLKEGSVQLNGVSGSDPALSTDGQILTFAVGNLAPAGSLTIRYVVEVTAGSRLGKSINYASAISDSGNSNVAKAAVMVRDDLLRTKAILMGRITSGACPANGEEPKDGLEGARVYLEDGSFVVSDKQGLFHFEGVRSGLHVVQLDLDSLPEGYQAVPCTENSRFAGRAFSQFVEVQGGSLWRADFHVKDKNAPVEVVIAPPAKIEQPAPAVTVAPVPAPPVKGRVGLELANRPEGTEIVYNAALHGGTVPVRELRLNVEIPPCTTYIPGSSMLDGKVISDPATNGTAALTWNLGDMPGDWERKLTFRAQSTPACAQDEMGTRAYLAFTAPNGSKGLTAPAETKLQQVTSSELHQVPDIVVRPHFPSFGAELNLEDRTKLDELARLLKFLKTESINVTGHTDNVPISQSGRRLYKDNLALSWARARSVGRYLMEALHFPPEKLSFDGKGESVPVASNKTKKGRALNRRVEVRASASRVVEHSQLNIIKEISGPLQVETEAEPVEESPAAVPANLMPAAPQETAPLAAVKSPDATAPVAASTLAVTSAAGTTGQAPAAVPVPPVTSAPASPASTAAPATVAVAEKPQADGLISPKEGSVLLDRINSVQAQLDNSLLPKLLVDGVEVPAERIGYRSVNQQTGKTLYSYIGVDFGEKGSHALEFRGMDPFGNKRFSSSAVVMRTGEIARIKSLPFDGNVADGKTPVKVRVEIFDAEGSRLNGVVRLPFREGTLRPYQPEKSNLTLDDKTSASFVTVDSDGWILFQPVTVSGSQRALIGDGKGTIELETYVKPKMRDWILVGLAEGTLGYNSVSGNMENLKANELTENFYQDGRVAFFAKGQIKGEWLLTASYDTAKTKSEVGGSLFQQIDPDSYYTLYGDATQQQYDAASSQKLYVRVEREQFYAMFGDFDTGLTVTELSRYSRRMTGAKTEFQNKNVEINAFAAESVQAYKRDEIPGDGTSGLYRLSGKSLLANSEKVTIITRDRYRSEIVISSKPLSRFVDYSIDYDAGKLFFKMPIPSKDEKFNPITILVEYETAADAGQDYTYGGRAGLKLFDKRLKVGISHVHEGLGQKSSNLFGIDTTIQLDDSTKFRGEAAWSEARQSGATTSGYSYLAELLHNSKKLDLKAYVREQQGAFGLGQQMGSEAATRKLGLDANYRFTEMFSLGGSVNRQTNMSNSSERDVAEAKASYGAKQYGVSLGILQANDRLTDGRSMSSGQITLGGRLLTLKEKLTLTIDHAQSLWGDANVDFPTRTMLGGEYKVSNSLSLIAGQEFTWGKTAETSSTRVGIKAAPWKGAALTSSIERQLGENNSRVFANAGLRQTWQLSDAWKVDAGIDRSQTIKKNGYYLLNGNVQPSSGGSEDFTAVSSGATYQVNSLTWDSRFEYRTSNSEDKLGMLTGVVKEQQGGWAWSARGQYFRTNATSGLETRRGAIRAGLVYRPPMTKWIHLNRLDLVYEDQHGGETTPSTSWRMVNNYSVNYKPKKYLQATLKYGAKFVMDTISGRRYQAFTDHTGFELRYDITAKWDIGLRGSVLHSWNGGQFAYSGGASSGYNVVDNAWVSLGYNAWGFTDKDFSAADYTAQGPYVRFRMKFDQQSVKDAAGWLNKE
ncbi:MAG: OmpA family protein [Geobacter sp.]|nr:OmpA family protein [Geobacter sp.]